MPSVLKHTDCPACGHRHHFCFLGDDLTVDREYDFLCPETAKKARLRPTTTPEIARAVPQGAVALTAAAGPADQAARPPRAGGSEQMQEVLPKVKDLAAKVGGMEKLSNIVETLKDSKE